MDRTSDDAQRAEAEQRTIHTDRARGTGVPRHASVLALLERDPRVVVAYETTGGIAVFVRPDVDPQTYRAELIQEISDAVVSVLAMEAPTPDRATAPHGGDCE